MLRIIADTRQHDKKHELKNAYFEKEGITVINSKLPFGDYALLTDLSRVIDTKRNLQELVGNVIQGHERFSKEVDNCFKNGIEIIILIEEKGMRKLEDVKTWKNPRLRRWRKIRRMHEAGKWTSIHISAKPPTDNISLLNIMWTFGKKHHVRWEFCDPEDAGRRVIELLLEGKDERKDQT